MEDSDLYIPVRIRKRKELIDGITKAIFIQIIICSVLGTVIGVVGYLIKGYEIVYVVFPTIICGFAGYVFLRKNQFNQNTIDLVRITINFYFSQKSYQYKYHNIYEKQKRMKENEIE